jgi:hypothetical protein
MENATIAVAGYRIWLRQGGYESGLLGVDNVMMACLLQLHMFPV